MKTDLNETRSNPLLSNLPMSRESCRTAQNSHSEVKMPSNGSMPSGVQNLPNVMNGTPTIVNTTSYTYSSYPVATHSTFPIMANGMMPMPTRGLNPMATQGAIPIPVNYGIPMATNGMMPIAPNGYFPLQFNGGMPMPTLSGNQGMPMTNSESAPIYTNGAIPLQQNRQSDGQTQNSNNGGQMFSSVQQTAAPQLNNKFPQSPMYIIPSGGQPSTQINSVMKAENQPVMNNSMEILNAKSQPKDVPQSSNRPFQKGRVGQSELSSGSFSSQSDGDNEFQSSKEKFAQDGSGNFSLQSNNNNNQQGSTSDTSSNNAKSSSNNSGNHGHQKHYQSYGNNSSTTTTHQTKIIQQTNGFQPLLSSQQFNGAPNGWVYMANGQPQGGPMYIPVSQPFNPTTTPQVSYCFTGLPPWQNHYGPAYQNNSYIYNNSTTFSNYNNTFPMQQGIGYNPNIIVQDFSSQSRNNFTPQTSQVQSSFENINK